MQPLLRHFDYKLLAKLNFSFVGQTMQNFKVPMQNLLCNNAKDAQ